MIYKESEWTHCKILEGRVRSEVGIKLLLLCSNVLHNSITTTTCFQVLNSCYIDIMSP